MEIPGCQDFPLGVAEGVQGNAYRDVWRQYGCRRCWNNVCYSTEPPTGVSSPEFVRAI